MNVTKKCVLTMLVLSLVLPSCAPDVSTTPTPQQEEEAEVPTVTPTSELPTIIPEPTVTPSPTSTPSPIPTPTSLPEDVRESILQTYKVMLFVQFNTNLLNETAIKVNTGELAGFESFGALLAVASMVNAVEEAIEEFEPDEMLSDYWRKAEDVHDRTKELVSKWFNQEIYSDDVLEEIDDLLIDIENTLSQVDRDLAEAYGFEQAELKAVRDEMLASLEDIFATPTPVP
jgi:hypothetical protein